MSRPALSSPRLNSAAALVAVLAALAAAPCATAQSGFYVGAGIGVSGLEAAVEEGVDFDDQDFGYKAFGGFNFDVPFLDFAVEGGYTDLGSASTELVTPGGGVEAGFDARGWNAFGLVAADVGPLAVFGKLGLIRWDVDASARFRGQEPGDDPGDVAAFLSDTGTDIAAGLGARIGVGPVQIRGEAEFFWVGAIDNAYLLSTSLVWQF